MQAYLITNLVNGDLYVGQTRRRLAQRWASHKSAARCGGSSHLHRAMRKYGIENFIIDCVRPIEYDITSEKELNAYETEMIRALRNNCRLYNLTCGGDGCSGRVVSEETRLRIGKGHKGKTISPDVRHKMAASHTGRKQSAESSRKKSEKMRGNHSRPKVTDDQIIEIVNLRHFGWTQSRLAQKFGTHQSQISRMCSGKRMSSISGVCRETIAARFELRKTHCNHGHDQTPDNLTKRGRCRECNRIHQQTYSSKKGRVSIRQ